jgi:hypothetical protein
MIDGRWPMLGFLTNKIIKDTLDGATKGLKAYAER